LPLVTSVPGLAKSLNSFSSVVRERLRFWTAIAMSGPLRRKKTTSFFARSQPTQSFSSRTKATSSPSTPRRSRRSLS
ncbi:hypothetical protein H0H93_007368, partial [Arthromyces matolae]